MKEVLSFLDGKKTVIATIYWSVLTPMLPIIYTEGIPENVNKWYLSIGLILSAFGLGHKGVKSVKKKKTPMSPTVEGNNG